MSLVLILGVDMSKDTVARQILAQQLMQQGAQNTSPLAAGINSFTGSYMLAKEGAKADAEKKALADALSGVQQAQPLPADFMGPGTRTQQPGGQDMAKQALINTMIGSSDSGIQKAGLSQMFPSMGAGSGGQIEYMYNKIKAEHPEMSDTEILHAAQTGFRRDMKLNADGSVAPVVGALDSKEGFKFAETTGGNKSDLMYKPQIAGRSEEQKQKAEAGGIEPRKLEEKRVEANIAAMETTPILQDLAALNKGTIDSPYAAAFQPFLKVGGSDKATKLDLMKQARLELAAPLAKQLGVNPTDKDFQASLDRIFDIQASQPSREAQIAALAERIKGRAAIYNREENIPSGGNIGSNVNQAPFDYKSKYGLK